MKDLRTKKNQAKKATIIKLRAYATIDREEVFLNEMCAQGWKPVKIILGMIFLFEKCEPGEYIARVASAIDPNDRNAIKKRREQMTEYLTDSGAEIIPEINVDSGTRIYAIRRADMGEFEINTDIDALITEYTARRKYHIYSAIISAVLCAIGTFISIRMKMDNYGGANMEFFWSAVLFICFWVMVIPIPSYTRVIKELQEKRKFEE